MAPCYFLTRYIWKLILTPRKESTYKMKSCKVALWNIRAVSTPLTSETPLNQTGPITDTYGVIWHIHFTHFLCGSLRHIICENQTKIIRSKTAGLESNKIKFASSLLFAEPYILFDSWCWWMVLFISNFVCICQSQMLKR